MNAEISIEKITPAMARESLLNMFEGQRNRRNSYSDRLATEMTQGRWKLSPDAIVYIKGKLANGQHRLEAVVKSNKAQMFLVLRTNDESIYAIMDSGVKRTICDSLGKSINYGTTISAAAGWVCKYDQHCLSFRGGKTTQVTRGQQRQYIVDHQDTLSESARIVECLANEKSGIRVAASSMTCAFMEIAGRYDIEMATEFITRLYKGDCEEYPGATHPAIKQLRDRLIKERMSKAANKEKMPSYYVFALLIKAYNAFRNKINTSVLRIVAGEEYPRVHGEPIENMIKAA